MKITGQSVKKLGLVLGPALFFIVLLLPVAEDFPLQAKIVLAATFWMGAWWITEAIPIYVTALLPLVIFPSLGITELNSTSANYADRVVFLFLGGFLLAKAVERSGLHHRFALNILKIFGTNPKYVVAAFMLVTGFLSGWMSNTATTMLMLPIAVAVISQFQRADYRDRFGLCLMLCIAYSASIGGMATLIGTPPNAIFASLSRSILDVEIGFGQWLLIGMPISSIALVIAWLYMVNFGASIRHIGPIAENREMISRKVAEIGKMGRNEFIVAAVFAITATAWITRGLLWKDWLPAVDDSTIAILAAISLFLIPLKRNRNTRQQDKETRGDPAKDERLLDWKTAISIPWGVLLLIGGGLALAHAFTSTGLDDWVADRLSFVGSAHVILVTIIVVAVAVLASEIISNTATAALLIPISASLAASLQIEPLLIMIPVAVATSFGFAMPVGTPPNAIVFASGYVTVPKMVRAGLPLDIIGIILVSALTFVLVPLILP
jgi:solute carrier family 13 (sodium-dependent dicarboxylate transporter), member 2/3/5